MANDEVKAGCFVGCLGVLIVVSIYGGIIGIAGLVIYEVIKHSHFH
jgi:hypothetical protein